MDLFGRRVIYTDVADINSGNIVDELNKAMGVHRKNQEEEDYLYWYYRGKQPILNRKKEIRPEICNKIVENVAYEIVRFKTDYQCGKPIQYIGLSKDDTVTQDVSLLNKYMACECKEAKDIELFEWMFTVGVGNRLAMPRKVFDDDEAPFEIYTLDPRTSFVVYSSDVDHRPMMGVKFRRLENEVTTAEESTIYSVYTKDMMYTIEGTKIVMAQPHTYGCIPIYEYPANNARLGSFEVVLGLLNAINNVQSNRMDGIEQNIQAFLKFINCEVDKDQMDQLRELGAIMIKSIEGQRADVDSVKTENDQGQTQITKDDLYQRILTICGMPNRNGGSSTSDTGAAVEMRDGFEAANSRARGVEAMFKASEKQMLRFVLRILRTLSDAGQLTDVENGNKFQLGLIDTEIKFTRTNYDNIQSKSQVLTTMLDNPKIHPLLAFTHCGMFSDPESAYQMSEKYYQQVQKEEEERLNQMTLSGEKTGEPGGDD